MPRELVHWKVLSLATDQLPSGVLRSSLVEHSAASQIGAMAPDAPYYFRLGGTPFEAIAEKIHGAHGEDTFDPIRTMFQTLSDKSHSGEIAFIAGFLSHLVTDIYFHPMVYALSGNYYDIVPEQRKRARADHRLLETYLDEAIRQQHPGAANSSMLDLRRQLPTTTFRAIERLLESALPSSKSCWATALRHMHILQHIFVTRSYSRIAHAINAVCSGKFVDKVVLFRPLSPVPPALTSAIDFHDPVTNETRQVSVESLTNAAATRLLELFVVIQNQLEAGAPNVLEGVQGESLNTGTLGGRNSQMLYFPERKSWKDSVK